MIPVELSKIYWLYTYWLVVDLPLWLIYGYYMVNDG